MTWLLDGNVLAALMIDTHVHHQRVRDWFGATGERFASCVITQGTLLRVHMAMAADATAAAAWRCLEWVERHPRHEFWGDPLPWREVPHRNLQGPKQVTDAWLAESARRRAGRLLTLDTALVGLHSDVAELLP
jgi:uncharacterized protein